MRKPDIFSLDVSSPSKDTHYIATAKHPGVGTPGCVALSVKVRSEYPAYKGPDIVVDFDEYGVVIGIEILE